MLLPGLIKKGSRRATTKTSTDWDHQEPWHKKVEDWKILSHIITHDPCIQKFGFINGVDNVNWPPYRDSKSWHFRANDEGLTLKTSAFRISVRWPIYIINSVDKTKFLYTTSPPRSTTVSLETTPSFIWPLYTCAFDHTTTKLIDCLAGYVSV